MISADSEYSLPLFDADYSADNSYWKFTCISNSISKLIESSIDVTLKNQVNQLITAFKSPELQDELLSRGGVKLTSFCNAKLNTYHEIVKSCATNLKLMRQLVGENKYEVIPSVVQLLFNNAFELQLNQSVRFLKHILDMSNKDNDFHFYTRADAVEDWLKLHDITDNESYKILIEEQLETILNPVSLTANYLHPLYLGRRFMNIEKYSKIVHDFVIDELDARGLKDLVMYKGKDGIFSKNFFFKLTSFLTFWKLADGDHPNLSKFSLKVLEIPAYTCRIQVTKPIEQKHLNFESKIKCKNLYYALKINENRH